MRILSVEPHGEGGICHYTYCLCAALQKQGCEITLATAYPYELLSAPRAFELTTPFGPGRERRVVQSLLRRFRQRNASALADKPGQGLSKASGGIPAQDRLPASGFAGQVSRWLARREYRSGWKRIVWLAQRLQITGVHIQWLSDPEHDLRWLETLRRNKVRVVLTIHNVLPHDAPASTRALWQRLYQAADAVIAHYQEAEKELKILGVDGQRIHIIPHGNYLPIHSLASAGAAIPQSQQEARLQLGLPAEAPVALFFGLMRPYKGIEYLLGAFNGLQQEHPEAKLLLAGRAPKGFQPFASAISALALEDACVTMPRYLQLSEIARCFLAADVVVLPYLEASQSGVLQLAYAFHRPVIATRVGGLPESIISGKTGVLVPPRDADALAAALADMLRDRQRCQVMGEQAYQLAQEKYSWELIARATREVYQCVFAC